MEKQHIVVMGGGTGTHTLLRGLKRYKKRLAIAAIVTMADSGGSTGRLRDEFGQLPVGDVRMALAALASDIDEHEELVRQLFLYRFDKGDGLCGHNFGNLLLVALTDILGSEEAAIRAAARVLRVGGSVVPVTTERVDLVATYDDGVTVIGEHEIDEPPRERAASRIVALATTPNATISDAAEKAILDADLIVLGPGDLYTSILANCVIEGVPEALRHSTGKLVFVANLMTRLGQTTGFGVAEMVGELERYIKRPLDHVLYNSTPLPADLLARYEVDGELPVLHNAVNDVRVIAADLLATEEVVRVKGDVLKRSLIRHDSRKLARQVIELL
jgi:uncharacterized cofD-like protein